MTGAVRRRAFHRRSGVGSVSCGPAGTTAFSSAVTLDAADVDQPVAALSFAAAATYSWRINEGAPLDGVVTHGHADHVGGAAHFRERYGAKIIAGGGDRAMLAAGKHEAPLCPTDFIARRRLETDQNERFTPLQADLWIDADPRETVALDLKPLTGVDARVIALPGHTDGSLIVVTSRFALVGDLFRGSIPGWSATRHFYICDLADNQRDLRELLTVHAKDATTFLPGHFGPIERASVQALAEQPPTP